MYLPIIAVGSSAGGVAALETLVAALPAAFPGALLFVNHVAPTFKSQLADILARSTALKVQRATDGDRILAGHVYVAPPDRHLLLEGHGIRVTSGPRESRHRPSIDVLFRSCSIALGTHAIGVVLSGGLDDGTAGLWMIKDCGGTVIVQDPDEAEHPAMAESAISQVETDYIARLEEMPDLFARVMARNATRAPN